MSTSRAAVAAIRRALDVLAGIDPSLLSDQDIRDDTLDLAIATRQLAAQFATRIALFDARDLAPADGCRDVKSFLTAFTRQSAHHSTGLLKTGRTLRILPEVCAATTRGDIPAEHLRLVQDLVKDIGDGKAHLLDNYLAATLTTATVKQTADVCDEIRAHLDPDGPPPDDRDHHARHLTLTPTSTGVKIHGRLDVETGSALLTALDALQRPPTADDDRTPAQRRVDALGDLVRVALDAGTLPLVGGERPHLGLLITPAALTSPAKPQPTVQDRADRFLEFLASHDPPTLPTTWTTTHEADPGDQHAARTATCGRCGKQTAAIDDSAWLNWIGTIPTTLAERIACDAAVWRIILDPATRQPLDVGRAHRTAPHWIRKALHTRDRHCRFPGCDMPPQWTQAHHLDHWTHGGHTDLKTMLLLCTFHHHRVHAGWTIHLNHTTGDVTVTKPDGTPYELGPTHHH